MAKKRRKKKPRAKLVRERKRAKTTCLVKDCAQPIAAEGSCRTCEAQVELGKRTEAEVYKVAFCQFHLSEATAKLKRHALLAHPQNIPKAVLAGLTGALD